jgi:hypothetical protein
MFAMPRKGVSCEEKWSNLHSEIHLYTSLKIAVVSLGGCVNVDGSVGAVSTGETLQRLHSLLRISRHVSDT